MASLNNKRGIGMRLSLLAFSSALALLAASGSALSQEQQHSGVYLGGSVGQATMDYAGNAVPFPAATQSTLDKDDRNAGFKLFAGYRINDNFALEGGYSNYGTFSATRNDPIAGSIRADTKVTGGHLDGLIIYPMDRLSVFARVGIMLSNTKTVYSGSNGATPTDTDAKGSHPARQLAAPPVAPAQPKHGGAGPKTYGAPVRRN